MACRIVAEGVHRSFYPGVAQESLDQQASGAADSASSLERAGNSI